MRRRVVWFSLAFGVLGLVALATHPLDWKLTVSRPNAGSAATLQVGRGEAQAQTAAEGIQALRSQGQAFVQIAKQVLPSVVSITSERTIKVTNAPGGGLLGDDFFGRFFQPPESVPQQGSGSGVIVSKDGYILTNNHVVANAEKLTVTLEDGRKYDGELVGRDPKSDVAVIRINHADDLTPMPLGDSNRLEVGEWVMAIGNPFQLSSTVTAGIVSAVGRSNIGLADYEDFIQTDAAINPGNSGGALVNLDGELVGINTAIATRSGGYQGVGFAIPIDMAKKIMDSLISNGKVVRGWLGVSLQDLNEDMAEAFNLQGHHGALVGQVMDNSPAAKAGIRQGDLITAFEGQEVKDVKDLRLRVIDQAPGTQVRLQITRDGKEVSIPVKLGELENDSAENDEGQMNDQADTNTRSSDLGMALQDLTARTRQQLDLPGDVDGVLVVDVEATKPAGRAGLRPEDVILKVGDKPVNSVRAVERELHDVPTGKSALLLVRRENAEIFLAIRMPEK